MATPREPLASSLLGAVLGRPCTTTSQTQCRALTEPTSYEAYADALERTRESSLAVRSSRVEETPMSHGLVAFGKRSDAQAREEQFEGEIVNWDELVQDGEP